MLLEQQEQMIRDASSELHQAKIVNDRLTEEMYQAAIQHMDLVRK